MYPFLNQADLEAYMGAPNPQAITPDLNTPTTLYCAGCDCSQRALPGTVCWFCGGETTHTKPSPPWPPNITGPAMYAPQEPEENAA